MSVKKKNIFVRIKDWFVSLHKGFWRLSLDAKIGIIFLIPPIIGLIKYLEYCLLYGEQWFFKDNTENLLYYGLMAIAGACLIKGKFGNKDRDHE